MIGLEMELLGAGGDAWSGSCGGPGGNPDVNGFERLARTMPGIRRAKRHSAYMAKTEGGAL